MQLVEASSFAVRSAVIQLRRPDTPLGSCCFRRSQEPMRMAVVYGAAHMPAVVRSLARYGYRASSAEWLTVFGY